MINQMDMNFYKEEMNEKKYEEIYKDLVNKIIVAINELGKKKGYKVPEDKSGAELFRSIQVYFKENFITTFSVYYLMKRLIEWNYEKGVEKYTRKLKIKSIILRYYSFLDKIKLYEETENEIAQKGINVVIKEREEKYVKQFKKKYEHNEKYNETWDILELIKKVYLEGQIDIAKINDVEKVILIDNAYKYIMKIGYPQVAYIYSDEYSEFRNDGRN